MDFDSEELLLSAFDEEFQVEDETQELRVQDLPFSNCNDTFQDFKFKIDNLQKKKFPEETFGYDNLPSDILENMTLQNILGLQMGYQEDIKEYLVQQLNFILAKYATQISDQKDSILRINLCLGALNSHTQNELFHLNLMAKFLLIHQEEFDRQVYEESENFSGLLRNIVQMSTKITLFKCGCVKNLFLYLASKKSIMPQLLECFKLQKIDNIKGLKITLDQEVMEWTTFWSIVTDVCDDIELTSEFHKSLEVHFKQREKKSNEDMKIVLDTLMKVTEKTALSLEMMSVLWDYFRDHLNSNFNDDKGVHMELYLVPVKTPKDYLSVKKPSILTKFAQVFGQHLQKVPKPDKDLQRFFTRMRRTEFFLGLKEMGIFNFCAFFIELYKISGQERVFLTFTSYIDSGLDQLTGPEKFMSMSKGLAGMNLLELQQNVDSSSKDNNLKKLKISLDIFIKKCLERPLKYLLELQSDRAEELKASDLASKMVKIYLELLQEGIIYDHFLAIEGLLSPIIFQYLEKFAPHEGQESTNNAKGILQTLTEIVTRIRVYYASLQNRGLNTLTSEELEVKDEIDKNLKSYFLMNGGKIVNSVKNLAQSLTAPISTLVDLSTGIILLDDFKTSDEFIEFMLKSPLVKPSLTHALLTDLTEREYPKSLEPIFLQAWITNGLWHTTNEIPSLSPLLSKTIDCSVKTVADFVDFLGQKISKINYNSVDLQQIKNQFWFLVEPFLDTRKRGASSNYNYDLIGLFVSKTSPLLHFKFKFGGLHLKNLILKLTEPLSNPKWTLQEKNSFKKILPEILQGLVFAVEDFERDDYIKKTFKEILKLSMEKYESKDLEETLNWIWKNSSEKLQIFFMKICQDNLTNNSQGLPILLKSLEICDNAISYEILVKYSFEKILKNFMNFSEMKQDTNLTKKYNSQIFCKIFDICDKNRGNTKIDFSFEIQRILIEYSRIHLDSLSHSNVTKMLKIVKRLSAATFAEIFPFIENNLQNLKRRNPHLGQVMENSVSELKRQKI